jgi:hypothetical protein
MIKEMKKLRKQVFEEYKKMAEDNLIMFHKYLEEIQKKIDE